MSKVTKNLWSGILTVEGEKDQFRFTITSKSTGEATASVDMSKEEVKEFSSEILTVAYGTGNTLPSAHQINDEVVVNFWKAKMNARVLGIHFYEGKVKYDLEVFSKEQDFTRIYNIDSAFVTKYTLPEPTLQED